MGAGVFEAGGEAGFDGADGVGEAVVVDVAAGVGGLEEGGAGLVGVEFAAADELS